MQRKIRKAQSMVFEQVILFSIGVMIFLMCFAAFNIYQNHFVTTSLNDQLGQMKNWVSSYILKLTENAEANTSIILEIPRTIAGEEYEIEIDESGISVRSLLTQTVKHSLLFNLSSQYTLSGKARSVSRRFIIYKKGNEIIIS